MPLVPTGFVEQTELDEAVGRAISQHGPDVVRVNYKVGVDTTDEPCLRFRIILTDDAANPSRLGNIVDRICSYLSDELHPYSRWGLFPYYNFRSVSEQSTRHEPEWS